ncbi:MAG: M48 family metalloprotease [Crocinitomicaceae bacterium]|nr:M48 family metalloprotease [Crocinitomicaceae bacterium]
MKAYLILTSLISSAILVGCGLAKDDSEVPDGGFNLFTVQQDRDLGMQVAQEIESNPAEYPILDSASNVKAYKYIYDIRNKILATGKVKHKNEFAWRIRIINDEKTLNAFCTPGGYIYVYTGIIKYLDNESQLAGVMGHEMGHADLRHSTRQMTKLFGVQILMNAALGDSSAVGQITTALIGLSFSRDHETEADRMSVEYLCPTDWPADGAAGFFEKIEASGGVGVPEWLSTHPSPENRINNYHTWATESGCGGSNKHESEYDAFKRLF